MFGLQKYVEKIYDIEWKFNIEKLQYFEELFFVKFQEKDNGNFVIEKIHYSYVDILYGLEDINFILKKSENDIIIEITD